VAARDVAAFLGVVWGLFLGVDKGLWWVNRMYLTFKFNLCRALLRITS
jgi:hypothetical protein